MTDRDIDGKRMLELCHKVSAVLAGNHFFDCASVCALCCIYAIKEGYPDNPAAQRKALKKMTEFMKSFLEGKADAWSKKEAAGR